MDYRAVESTKCEGEEIRTASIRDIMTEVKKELYETRACLEEIIVSLRGGEGKPEYRKLEANDLTEEIMIIENLSDVILSESIKIRSLLF